MNIEQRLGDVADRQEIEVLRRLYAKATDTIGLATHEAIEEGRAIYHRIFTPDVKIRTSNTGADPLTAFAHRTVLEITEREALEDGQELQRRLKQLRALGYRIAIDDLVPDDSDNCPLVSNPSQEAINNLDCDNDTDEDGVPDSVDNCVATRNFEQFDMDGDSIGDLCDGDTGGDGTG